MWIVLVGLTVFSIVFIVSNVKQWPSQASSLDLRWIPDSHVNVVALTQPFSEKSNLSAWHPVFTPPPTAPGNWLIQTLSSIPRLGFLSILVLMVRHRRVLLLIVLTWFAIICFPFLHPSNIQFSKLFEGKIPINHWSGSPLLKHNVKFLLRGEDEDIKV